MTSYLNTSYLPQSTDSEASFLGHRSEGHRVPFALLLLIGAFFIITPLSISTIPYVLAMKYARFAVLGLAGLIAIRSMPRLGKLSKAWILLGIFYAVSSLWSPMMVTAFGYKSMFLGMILGGICLGNTAMTLSGVVSFAKSVVWAGLIFYAGTAAAIQLGIAEPIHWFNDRLSVLGLNSNFVGVFSTAYYVAAIAV